jgi:hypothetical protein
LPSYLNDCSNVNKRPKQGTFEGLIEQGEAPIFVPWFRICAMVRPAEFDSVA